MASIIAQQVLSEIGKIAGSDAPLPKRCAEAITRINQFKADLQAPNIKPEEADKQKESLRRTLQRGATHHGLSSELNSVYAKALDVLMG